MKCVRVALHVYCLWRAFHTNEPTGMGIALQQEVGGRWRLWWRALDFIRPMESLAAIPPPRCSLYACRCLSRSAFCHAFFASTDSAQHVKSNFPIWSQTHLLHVLFCVLLYPSSGVPSFQHLILWKWTGRRGTRMDSCTSDSASMSFGFWNHHCCAHPSLLGLFFLALLPSLRESGIGIGTSQKNNEEHKDWIQSQAVSVHNSQNLTHMC